MAARRTNEVSGEGAELRRKAETRLARRTSGEPARVPEVRVPDGSRLQRELEVHQVELELQNEELRAARLETEAALARYTELFDFAPVGYATVSPDGTVREVNHAGAQMLGRPRPRLVGTKIQVFVAAADVPMLDALLERALASEKKEDCEVEITARARRARAHVTAVALPHAEPLVLLAFQDVTERSLREEKLRQAEAALRTADRNKDEFLATLSHELRNPLAPIRNSLFVLTRAQPGSDQARRAQAVIDRQVGHLARLVDDLLDVTRITRGKVQLHKERVELGDIVRRTMDDHRTSFEVAEISLEGRFPPELFWVEGDPVRLTQAVSNLLGNAEKFTPSGGLVVVRMERQGPRVSVSVRDTGAGIAPDVLDRVFEPFSQGPQTLDRSRGGLGLGLAMVRGLTELHGGSVYIASDGPGKGTEVSISLPLERGAAAGRPEVEPGPARSRRVLVIEDNRDAADTLGEALALTGHEVAVAYDGPRGLELALTFGPEVVVCDLGLPGMDGYAVASVFRADPRLEHTYLVALSGYAQPEDVQRAAAAGFDRHVAKPPSLDQLDRMIAAAPARGAAEGHGPVDAGPAGGEESGPPEPGEE